MAWSCQSNPLRSGTVPHHLSSLHHEPHPAERRDVARRVAIHGDQVGQDPPGEWARHEDAEVDDRHSGWTKHDFPEGGPRRIFDEHVLCCFINDRIGVKLLDEFNIDESSIPTSSHDYLITLDWINRADNLCLVGPAGTGKTYLAVANAVALMRAGEVDRIILSRPAVEAGERLGFLPGDIREKVDPYLRPLYDALYDMLEVERAERLLERGVIEVAPLAFMRGRTLNEAFVILDEAQNTTVEQMKMFLTRIGFGSRAVVTGDVTQTDLPVNKLSGLRHAAQVLKDGEGVSFVWFTARDVVPHPLVQRVV